MKKKIGLLAILAALFITAGFTACGEDTPTADTSSSVEQSTPSDSSSEEPQKPDDNEGDEGDTLDARLEIVSPQGVVYPYVDAAKNYLLATKGTNVADYKLSMRNPTQDIVIEWECDGENLSGYLVEYYSKADKSDLVRVEMEADETSLAVRNLYKSATYQVSVSALVDGNVAKTAKSEFETTDLGPRVMSVDGIYNVRDLGGYKIADGKTTLQGLMYRGGALRPYTPYDSDITEAGKLTMSQEMKIKTDFDLRGYGEESGYLTESPIPGAELLYGRVGAYNLAFTLKENYRQVFSAFADKNNYPIYMHCTGGADRTGTVSFLLNALLGVSEAQLIQDYEFTTFSTYGERNSLDGTTYGTMFQEFLTKLKAFEGESLAEKTESYLLSIGVTQIEIDNIRAIMLGEKTKLSIKSSNFNIYEDETLDITLGCYDGEQVESLTLGGNSVKFTQENGIVSVLNGDMPALAVGMAEGKLVADGEVYSFSFYYDSSKTVSVNEYLPLSDGTLTLEKAEGINNVIVNGEKVVEYGTYIKMNVKQAITSGAAGGWWLFIGSYGIHFRSGTFRVWTTTDGTNFKEVTPRVENSLDIGAFTVGAALSIRLSEIDEKTMRFDVILEDALGRVQTNYYDFTRIKNEIAEEDARLTVAIRCDSMDFLTITA